MSHPNYPSNADEDAMGVSNQSEDLHSIVGLVEGGLNEDGEMEWIGTQKQWDKYEELNNQEE